MSSDKVTNGIHSDSSSVEDGGDGKAISTIQRSEEPVAEPQDDKDGKDIGRAQHGLGLPSMMTLPVLRGDCDYNMSHAKRGHCLIFNHSTFDKLTKLGDRNGTDRDKDSIKSLFTTLGFKVEVFNNRTVSEVKAILDEYSLDKYHLDCDAFVVFYLSHGEEGHLYARNTIFKVEELFAPFVSDNCKALAGKPKMFFIQACRGEGLDSGLMVYESTPADEPDFVGFYKIPSHCDFLICWSTVPGHFSWRNTTNGSWFIQSLVNVFSKYAYQLDVLSMMTEVNRHLSIHFESNCPSNSHMHGMKQSAFLTSTLTRRIIFRPKKA